MAFKLEPYQVKIIEDTKQAFNEGHKWVFVQAPTRSGKTVIFCQMAKEHIQEANTDVLILVHDQKILRQIKKTFYRDHLIVCEEIIAKTKTISKSSLFGRCRVFVAMVETVNNRMKLPSFLLEMKSVGYIISDEAHLSNFKKIYKHTLLVDIKRVGFSATPLSADKNDHLYPTYFTKIVIGPSVKYLIEYNKINPARGVVKDITFVLSGNIDRQQIKLGLDGDFDKNDVADKLGGRQIQNTINAIIKHAYGKKLLCFNANKEHSKQVCAEMKLAGLNAKHMDSDSGEEWVLDCLKWFEITPGAILCNVRMTTTGFDEPSCEGTVINTLTKSLPLIKQMEARGGTPFQYPDGSFKKHHIILDMCDNTIQGGHGEWSDDVDWEKIFYDPKYSTPGAAPKKPCKLCGAVNSSSARICCVCEHPFDIEVAKEDIVIKTMKLISKDIDVAHTIEIFSSRGEYASMIDLMRQTAYLARKKIDAEADETFSYVLEQEEFDEIFYEAQLKIKEWRMLMKKEKINMSYESVRSIMEEKLEMYGFLLNFKLTEDGIYAHNSKKKL